MDLTHHDGSIRPGFVGVVVRLTSVVRVVREAADHPLRHCAASSGLTTLQCNASIADMQVRVGIERLSRG